MAFRGISGRLDFSVFFNRPETISTQTVCQSRRNSTKRSISIGFSLLRGCPGKCGIAYDSVFIPPSNVRRMSNPWVRMGRFLGFCGALLLALVRPSVSQAQVGAGVVASPSPATLNQTLVYTIQVTNTSTVLLNTLSVTNLLPTTTGFQSAIQSQGILNTTIPGKVILTVSLLGGGQSVSLTINYLVSSTGTLTNVVEVGAISSTNVLQVATLSLTNVVSVVNGTVDLGVTLAGPKTNILSGDQLIYTAVVTNGGPATAVGAKLGFGIPDGLAFLGLSPTNFSYVILNRTLTVTLDSLAVGASN